MNDIPNNKNLACSTRETTEEITALKRKWLASIELDGREKIIFELEILLKGLDRFFNIQNLPLTNMEQAIQLDFHDEVQIVLEFVERVVELAGKLLEASRRNDYQFRQYLENKILGDYERTRWREAVLTQRSPEESLFILYSTFSNLREIIRGLTKLNQVPYPVFFNVGSLMSREIVSNRFFNPTSSVQFRPEFDKVDNPLIGAVIRSIGDGGLQRQVSLIVLAFNRFLLYLHYINPRGESLESLKSSLLFFALIHSEAKYLIEFMEKALPAALSACAHPKAQPFLDACDSLSFQLQMELKKIHSNELINLSKNQKLDSVRISVENSAGIITNFFQQSVLLILRVFDESLNGEEIFPAFVSRKEQSIALRRDLALMQALMDKYEMIIETTEAGMSTDTFITYLNLQKKLTSRMRRETLPSMRYHDLVEFDKYFRLIESLTLDDLHLKDKLDKFNMESKFFKILLDTTIGQINNRAELQSLPLDNQDIIRNLLTILGG